MRPDAIIYRHVFWGLMPPFFMNLVFFLFVFLMRQILEITHLVVNQRVGMGVFSLMLVYSMPFFLSYIIPMSVMMSVLITFLRMSADNEIVALKAGGVSLYGLLPPVAVFSVLCAFVAAAMAVYGVPWGQQAYKRTALAVAQTHFQVGLKERQFIDSFDGVMFYVNKIDLNTNRLHDIYIEDLRDPRLSASIVSPRGEITGGGDKFTFVLTLHNGVINQADLDSRRVYATTFDTYALRLDLKDAVKNISRREKNEKEMGFFELMAYLENKNREEKKYRSVHMEFHKKFSIPFACIALGVLAVPLGAASFSTRKSAGLGLGLVAFLLYYLLLSAGMLMGESGRIPPALSLWLPNIIMGGLGLYLLVRTAQDRPVAWGRPFALLFRRLGGGRLRITN